MADVFHGDCVLVMRGMPEASIDAIVTDPPYDLTAGKKGGSGEASVNLDSPYGRARITTGFMGKSWDGTGIAFEPSTWAEALRVLKPGGYLIAFGGTRTWHRLACAIEDAGFEIRDSIAWLYGSGFPKSLDVGKAIDKAAGAKREKVPVGAPVKRMIPGADQNGTGSWIKDNGREYQPGVEVPATPEAAAWEGWGTALKPAHEPIVVARKPLVGTVAQNVLEHGTGAMNITACRVEANGEVFGGGAKASSGFVNGYEKGDGFVKSGRPLRIAHGKDTPGKTTYGSNGPGGGSHAEGTTDLGRWPPNVLLDGDQADELDAENGSLTSGRPGIRHGGNNGPAYGVESRPPGSQMGGYGDSGGASRFFPVFRYQAKAPGYERPKVDGVSHPTVKPIQLMRWLIKLVTPPGGVVLDPFAGSGTTLEAAIDEGFEAIGIEAEKTYIPLIQARLDRITPRLGLT